MNKLMSVATVALTVALVGTCAQAEEVAGGWSPLGVGIAAPVQIPFMSSDIYGIRLGGLLGINQDVYGLDAGAVEITHGDFAGIVGSGFNWNSGNVYGIQAGVVANCVYGDLFAIQAGVVNANYGMSSAGVTFGVVNYVMSHYGIEIGALNWNNTTSAGLQFAVASVNHDEVTGAMVGAFNFSRRLTGFQFGLVNMADEATGFQLGVFNAAEHMRGVQVGLMNIIEYGPWPQMVLMNASF